MTEPVEDDRNERHLGARFATSSLHVHMRSSRDNVPRKRSQRRSNCRIVRALVDLRRTAGAHLSGR